MTAPAPRPGLVVPGFFCPPPEPGGIVEGWSRRDTGQLAILWIFYNWPQSTGIVPRATHEYTRQRFSTQAEINALVLPPYVPNTGISNPECRICHYNSWHINQPRQGYDPPIHLETNPMRTGTFWAGSWISDPEQWRDLARALLPP